LAATWSFAQNRVAKRASTASRPTNGNGKGESVWELTKKLELVEAEMQDCKNRGQRREPHGDVWDDDALRDKHRTLRTQRDKLKERILT
jgi:hypothetical protein